jgi:hypothetical protein
MRDPDVVRADTGNDRRQMAGLVAGECFAFYELLF